MRIEELTFDVLGSILRRDPAELAGWGWDASLRDSAGLDSIELLEIFAILEDRAGRVLDNRLLESIDTLRDLAGWFSSIGSDQEAAHDTAG